MLNAWILKFGFFSTILTFTLLFYSENSYSEIYKWVDEKGEVHFTDNPADIPSKYFNQVEGIKEKTIQKSPQLENKKDAVKKPSIQKEEEMPAKEDISPNDPGAIKLVDDVKEEPDRKRNQIVYSGSVKNVSNSELTNVEMFFTVRVKDGTDENITLLIKGKKGEGILESGEIGNFTVQPKAPYSSISGYGYNFKWKFSTKAATQ
jgi:hypothetical protein